MTTKRTDSSSKWAKPSFKQASIHVYHYLSFKKGISLKILKDISARNSCMESTGSRNLQRGS